MSVSLEHQDFLRALDLGSGPIPKNPFRAQYVEGVDIRSFDSTPFVKQCSLGHEILPFEDSSLDVVTAFDVLEHIERVNSSNGVVAFPFIFLMNEVNRVLRTGGIFYSETPCYPMLDAFQDPTHVNIMTEDTLSRYFCSTAWARIYGFNGSFRLLDEFWRSGKYCCCIEKTVNNPDRDETTQALTVLT